MIFSALDSYNDGKRNGTGSREGCGGWVEYLYSQTYRAERIPSPVKMDRRPVRCIWNRYQKNFNSPVALAIRHAKLVTDL